MKSPGSATITVQPLTPRGREKDKKQHMQDKSRHWDSSVGKTVVSQLATYLYRTGSSLASGMLAKISSGKNQYKTLGYV